MRKRDNNEGNIYKRRTGLWEARASLADGRRKSFYGKTREKAHRAMTAALRDTQQGIGVPTGRLTLGAFLTDRLEQVVRPNKRPQTFVSYEGRCRVHIVPALGRKQLDRLTASDMQAFVNSVARTHSPSLAAHCRGVLRAALDHARRWKLVAANAAADADPPRVRRREVRPMTETDDRRAAGRVRRPPA